VIAAQLGEKGRVGAAQRLEHELAPFRLDLYHRVAQPPADLAPKQAFPPGIQSV